MLLLEQVVIVFEPEAACRQHLVAHGYPDDLAREIAVYLAQATDLQDFVGEIRAALKDEGLDASFVTLAEAAERLPRLDPTRSIVWCQTDGVRFYRGSSIPALARLLGLARYGSPPVAQHLCQDKFASLATAHAAGLPIPATRLLEDTDVLAALCEDALDWERATLFVKPATLGAKLGIFSDSRCTGFAAARGLGRRIWERYGDRAVVQAFVEGDDVRVSFMDMGGAFRPQVGIGRLRKNAASEAGGAFMTMRDNETLSRARCVRIESAPALTPTRPPIHHTVVDGRVGVRAGADFNTSCSGARDTAGAFERGRDAAFTPEMDDLQAGTAAERAAAAAILDHVDRLRRLLSLHDYFSMDFRIDASGSPAFFEFETCPAVTIYDFQHYLVGKHGLALGPALARSLRAAFQRAGSRGEA